MEENKEVIFFRLETKKELLSDTEGVGTGDPDIEHPLLAPSQPV